MNGKDAPSARSAADGRQASTGSRGSRAGGSAASGKTKPTFSREECRQYDAFVAALPSPLKALVPKGLPQPLVRAVLDATAHDNPAGRTVEQLIEYRLMPKWDKYYSSREQAGPIEKPVGVLVTMLRRDAECQDPRCDERRNVDTGEPCASCEMRAVDRRADREREQEVTDGRQATLPPERRQEPPVAPKKTYAAPAYVPPQTTPYTPPRAEIVAQAKAAVLANRGCNRVSRMP